MKLKRYTIAIAVNFFALLAIYISANSHNGLSKTDFIECTNSNNSNQKEERSSPDLKRINVSAQDNPAKHDLLTLNNDGPLSEEQSASEFDTPSDDAIFTPEHYLPEDINVVLKSENEFKKENFGFSSAADKLATIDHLTNNGDDLTFLSNVVKEPDMSPEIKIAAIQKIRHSDSYSAVNTLLLALDDRSENVALNALLALKDSHDDSLLPILKEKNDSLPDGNLKTLFSEAIAGFENRTVLEMDAQ